MPWEKNKPKSYIMSPHDDVGNFVANTVGIATHKSSRGKNAVKPVFKDSAQRKAFNADIKARLKGRKDTKSDEYKALKYLESRSGWWHGRMNFSGTATKDPKVYVQGHGSAGSTSISDNAGNRATSSEVAQTLNSMNLSKKSNVRAYSCYSATEHKIATDAGTVRGHVENDTIDSIAGDWNNTFAGSLQSELRKQKGRTNVVHGYIASTNQRGRPVETYNGHQWQQENHLGANLANSKWRRSHLRRGNP